MSYSSFVFENNEGVATIRLNDPERLNALTFQTYADLERITAEMAHDTTVKVVVLTGTGKGFCSGGRVDDIIGPLLGGNILARLSRRFGEGAINGALTARVGVAAMDVCRPLPFAAMARPNASGVVLRALKSWRQEPRGR